MIKAFEKAWAEGKIPIIQGIVTNNGLYYKIDNTENQFRVSNPNNFSFDFISEDFSDIDTFFTMNIEKYTLYCGEGSWGSDGFIYIEDTHTKKLFWCLFGNFNPIIKCTLSDNVLIAENNNNCQYIFEFHNPPKAHRICG